MALVWDYLVSKLKRSEKGRILILERQINFGPDSSRGEKIKLADVRKYWNRLNLFPHQKRLLEHLLWKS